MKLLLQDFFFFGPSAGREGGMSADSEVRQAASSGKGLKVTFVGSHAGMVNANQVMYSPKGMQDCSHTWTYPLPRPVQIHHDDSADPIGRVVSARFVPYGAAHLPDQSHDVSQKFCDAASKDEIFEAIKLIEDSGVLGTDEWRGVGELILDAIITDASAAEKILDGRYLGISISQRPQQAYCSICKKDWVADEPCEHHRGEVDEETKKRMYLIVGDTKYVEASYVNQPADEFAQNVSARVVSTMEDNEDMSHLMCLDNFQPVAAFKLIDSVAFENPNNGDDELASDSEDEESDANDPVANSSVENDADGDQDISLSDESDSDTDSDDEDEEEETEERTSPDLEETVEQAMKVLFAGDEGEFTEEHAEIINEALEKEIEEEDAKLTTKKRKNLPGSSFCGPNKSFPVNDCAHYTAAKRLIGRYKGPGSKSKILACVERKGRSLDCPGAKKSKSSSSTESDETKDNTLCFDCMSDEELGKAYLDVEKLMVARGMKVPRECDECEEKDSQIAGLTEQLTEVPELQDRVRILREEWKTVTQEHVASEEAHAVTLRKLETVLRAHGKLITLLTDKDSSEEEIDSSIEKKSLSDLETFIDNADTADAISVIRSGVANDPEGTVTQSDADVEVKDKKDPEDSRLMDISRTLVDFSRRYGRQSAQDYMIRQIRIGKLPEGFTLAKASELVAE